MDHQEGQSGHWLFIVFVLVQSASCTSGQDILNNSSARPDDARQEPAERRDEWYTCAIKAPSHIQAHCLANGTLFVRWDGKESSGPNIGYIAYVSAEHQGGVTPAGVEEHLQSLTALCNVSGAQETECGRERHHCCGGDVACLVYVGAFCGHIKDPPSNATQVIHIDVERSTDEETEGLEFYILYGAVAFVGLLMLSISVVLVARSFRRKRTHQVQQLPGRAELNLDQSPGPPGRSDVISVGSHTLPTSHTLPSLHAFPTSPFQYQPEPLYTNQAALHSSASTPNCNRSAPRHLLTSHTPPTDIYVNTLDLGIHKGRPTDTDMTITAQGRSGVNERALQQAPVGSGHRTPISTKGQKEDPDYENVPTWDTD